jgi:hypothetical protein
MKLDTLRMIVGFSIIGSHLMSFFLIVFGTDKLTMPERTELALLISPVFAVYVTAIVRQFVRQDATYDESPTHPALRILSIGTSTIFGLALPIIIYQFTAGAIASFPALKTTLGIIETALGIYTGAIVDRLFGGTGSRRARRATASSRSMS